MLRFTRLSGVLTAAALLAAALPAPAAAQRRTTTTPTTTTSTAATIAASSGLWSATATATARANMPRVERALAPHGLAYARLAVEQRRLLHRAFDDLFPGRRFASYALSDPQAQAMAFLALGPAATECVREDVGSAPTRRPDRGGEWGRGRTRCAEDLDSLSRDAAWINTNIQALGRSGTRRPRAEELATLRSMTERARAIVATAPGCGCATAGPDAESLLTATRQALAAHEGSSMSAWMSLGSTRVQRIAQLSEGLELALLRCMSGSGRGR